ncbi:uncharacterized protein LOC131037773 [Cryptomeria japonica]|uniref:uncharacterized protein LOC131037773 n=1 Tax=Cryptomeria japonica TaxID=3369 RepID=UPI0027D9F683|nr:uncharacterized protein LOC131037773 [Cryptomeria japonica]XP_059075640.1 uncharacterized protein LOC131037773 [Cryptomeria japonica]
MSQIDDIMLSAIDFGLQGYTGTPSTSRARPKKKNSLKMPKHVKKRPLSFVDMLNAPDSPMDQERAEVIALVSTSMVSHPQSIGEASQTQTPSRYGLTWINLSMSSRKLLRVTRRGERRH